MAGRASYSEVTLLLKKRSLYVIVISGDLSFKGFTPIYYTKMYRIFLTSDNKLGEDTGSLITLKHVSAMCPELLPSWQMGVQNKGQLPSIINAKRQRQIITRHLNS